MIDLEKEFSFYFRIINEARDNFSLYKGILSNIQGNEKRINQINSFLCTTLNALKFSFIMQTAKLIDDREDKNIFKFINYCKCHKNEFYNEFYDDFYNNETGEIEHVFLRKVNVIDDINNFDKELGKVSIQITNIKAHRDKIYAHNDKKYFYNHNNINDDFKVTYDDVEQILDIIFKHLNILSIDYNRRVYSGFASTLDDYLYMINKL